MEFNIQDIKKLLSEFIDVSQVGSCQRFVKNLPSPSRENILFSCFCCFSLFSRKYSLLVVDTLKTEKINSILDFGGGIGATTSIFKNEFPKAQIYYLDKKGSLQWTFAEKLFAKQRLNVSMIQSLSELKKPVDLVVAFELFEHVQNPLELLTEIERINSKFLAVSVSFNQVGYGHLQEYIFGNMKVQAKDASRLFHKELRKLYVYDKRCANFWNHHPKIYKKRI